MFELSRKVAAGNLYTNYYFKVDEGIDELVLDFALIEIQLSPLKESSMEMVSISI